MSLTIDITDVFVGRVTDAVAAELQNRRAASGADGWLCALWAMRPDGSPRTSITPSYSYPPEVADWLYRMWGLTVPAAPAVKAEVRPATDGAE